MACGRNGFTVGLRVGFALFIVCVLFSVAAAQTCVQPPTGLVSWWPGDGNADDIENGNDGTLANGATFGSGLVDQAFRFTASLNSGVRIPSSASLNPTDALTLDAWVFPFSFPNGAPSILRKDTNTVGTTQYLIAVGDGVTPGVAHCNIGTFAAPVGGSVPLNQWTHVACTYDRQVARLYLNGVEVAAEAGTQPIPTAPRELWIGNEEPLLSNGMIRQFDGLIDEVEIFNRALSASEIQAIFDAGSAGKCVYAFEGFFPPVDNLPTLNRVNAGRAIPLKFSLGGDEGLSVFAPGYPKSKAIPCDPTDPVDDIEETVTAGGSALSYDAATGTYTYVWKTDRAWAGTCRQLIVKLKDNSEHLADFRFMK
jgi:hypothetical protein